MKAQIIVAAILLYSGIKFSSPTQELAMAPAPVEVSCQKLMTQQTLTILLEDHAAPHWQLTNAQVWSDYYDGVIVITELVAEEHYLLRRSGVDIDVVLDLD
jgi:hypothetical protein